jgi:hypothetical protein
MLTTNGSLAVEAGVDRFGDDRVRVRRLLGHASDRSFEDGALVGAHGGSVATAATGRFTGISHLDEALRGLSWSNATKECPLRDGAGTVSTSGASLEGGWIAPEQGHCLQPRMHPELSQEVLHVAPHGRG